MILIPISIEKCVFSCRFGATALTSDLLHSTKSILYLASSFETVIRESALYKLVTFHNPNLISIIHCLGRLSKESIQVRGFVWFFATNLFFTVKGLLAPTNKPEDHPFSAVCGCLFNVLAATLHSWRPSLHLQPEDVPCCDDKGPT
jgi:hypothetical protein